MVEVTLCTHSPANTSPTLPPRPTDPQGRSVSYQYNSDGELISVADRAGAVTRFGYASVAGRNSATSSGNQDHNHLLARITDPRGQVVMANQFDEFGRLSQNTDALGYTARQEFDLAARVQRMTNRRGHTTSFHFDADGNVTQTVDALGASDSHTTYDWDASGQRVRTKCCAAATAPSPAPATT